MSDDYTSDTQTTGTVTVGGSTTGDIETGGDQDWFEVTLEAGKTYRIDLKGSPTGDGTLRNPYLRGVHDEDGDLIAGTTNNNGGTGKNSRLFFTADDDGTHYVAAGAKPDHQVGTYTLSVEEVTDDYAAGTETTGTVTVGDSTTGDIELPGDRDWFAVTLEAGKTYQIDLKGSPTGDGTLRNPYLRGVHDEHGDLIADTTNNNGGTGRNSRLFFTADNDGTHYVAAGAKPDHQVGTYTLSVEEVTDDYAAWTGTTGTVMVGGSTTGDIEFQGDRDWFAVDLEAGKTYRIDLEGSRTGDGTLLDPYLRGVHDAEGDLIAGTTNDNGGTSLNSQLFFTADDAGTYYVAAGAYGSQTGTYKLSVEEVTDDYAAGTETTGTVTVGYSTTGDIELPGDRDWFAVNLEAGKTYRIDLEGSRTGDGTLWDPYLRGVHDADGDLIAGTTNNDGGTDSNSRLLFTADDDGTYYVAAGAHYRSQLGTYKLSVEEVPADHAAGTETTGAVTVGGSTTGDIETGGDRDWFAVNLEAGKTYQIDLKGAPTGDGTLSDPYLRGVHDADGDLIAGTTDDVGGTYLNSRLFFTPDDDGTYYIAAGGAFSDLVGTYTLSVEDVSVPDDYAAGTGTTGTVTVGGSTTGEIELPGDRDWFEVTLEAGKTYRIDLKGLWTEDGTLLDPYLRGVHDKDGVLIADTWDNGSGTGTNSRLLFTADADGTYYVAAGANGSDSGSVGTYTLSVEEIPDDYVAGTDTTGKVTVGGSTTGDIEFSGDQDWFAVNLEANKAYRIDLEGAPTGEGTLSDPYLHGVHDANGVLIASTRNDNDGTGRNSQLFFAAADDGTYYVAAGANADQLGTYKLSVEEVSITDDYAAGTGTTGTVMVDDLTTGDIETGGDQDWFAVTLEANETYRIDLEGSRTEDGTLSDPYLHGVYDKDGVLIADTTDDDSGTGRNSQLFFTAAAAGTYYVAAGTHGSKVGTYTLSVRKVTDDDYAAGTETTGTVTVDDSTMGYIETRGDQDWFAVALEANKTYRIGLEGSRTGDGTLSDPYLRGVHDTDGDLIAGTKNDDGGTGKNSRLFFTADDDGTYYVAAGAHPYLVGTYTLSVEEVTDDYAAGTETTGAVTVGGSTTGDIELPGDRDWFAVNLEANKTYRIDLEGSRPGDGALSDPYLRGVHDKDGALLAGTTNDDGGTGKNSQLFFTPDDDGTYYVAASGHGSQLGTYTLSVEDVTDDYAAGTETTGTVTVGDSTTGKIELPGDQDWFAVTLDANKTYQIDLKGSPTGDGTLSDPILRGVHDKDGDLIAGTGNDDGGTGRNSQLFFTADDAGTYYVVADAFNVQVGTYTLSVEEVM